MKNSVTLRELIEWSKQLPEELLDCEIITALGGESEEGGIKIERVLDVHTFMVTDENKVLLMADFATMMNKYDYTFVEE